MIQSKGKAASGLASLLLTPVALVISPTSFLYLNNQSDLNYQLQVLVPFLVAAGAILMLGTCVYLAAQKFRAAKMMLALYYVGGVCGYIYLGMVDASSEIAGSMGALAGLSIAYLALSWVLFTRLDVDIVRPIFAAAGIFILVFEVVQFGARVESSPAKQSALDALNYFDDPAHEGVIDGGPNVYHLLLDQLGSEVFEHLMAEEDRAEVLRDFVYFPDTVAQYGKTFYSLPSIFLGQLNDPSVSLRDWLRSYFQSEQSFLYPLVRAGYRTFGFHFFGKIDTEPLFHHSARQKVYAEIENADNSRLFRDLWLAVNTPAMIASEFVDEAALNELINGRAASRQWPLRSYAAFRIYKEVEPRLPSAGRYTFLHFLIPHPPWVFDANCQEVPEGSGDYLEQSACAMTMLREFVAILKALDRYDDSLILIHSDHGYEVGYKDGNRRKTRGGLFGPTMSLSRSKALLLIKPPAEMGFESGFRSSPLPAALIDIAPTLLDILDLESAMNYEGYSLFEPSDVPESRERYYHWYESDGNYGLARLLRWTIKNSVIFNPKEIEEDAYWHQPDADDPDERPGSSGSM